MVFIVTGTAESGRNTVGRLLSEELGWEFLEAQNLHADYNVDARRSSSSLADADPSLPLETLVAAINTWIYEWRDVVLSCPMLTENERSQLSKMSSLVKIVCLEQLPGSSRTRLYERSSEVANSEFCAESHARCDPKDALTVDSSQQLEEIIAEITALLIMRSSPPGLRFSSSEGGKRNNPSEQNASALRRSG
ncbi:MAG: hypothetical protein WCF22_14495 [Candidatus Sulfotelmatobacter sp.]